MLERCWRWSCDMLLAPSADSAGDTLLFHTSSLIILLVHIPPAPAARPFFTSLPDAPSLVGCALSPPPPGKLLPLPPSPQASHTPSSSSPML
eukprot:767880-Hanusia_phi.AAC.12